MEIFFLGLFSPYLDKSVFALIRVQIAPQVLSEENKLAMLKFINEENHDYKPFKFYFNKIGTLLTKN